MKLLLDQNISFRVVKLLSTEFTVTHVGQEGLTDASDLDIRRYAIKYGYTIITFDDDFNKYNLLYGPPPQVIWIRKGNLSNDELASLLISKKEQITQFLPTPGESGILEII